MHRVLLSLRDAAVQELASRALARIAVPLDIAADVPDTLARLRREAYSVVVIERDDGLIATIGSALPARPVVIVTTQDKSDLDGEVVSLVVPEPYDAQILVGVILACVTPDAPPATPSPTDHAHRSER
jgi:hypothetical protein